MLDLSKIGSRITNLRKQQGFTQYELADKLYVTHQAVSKWENGKSIPSIEILYELTKLFDVSIDYLLDNTEIVEGDYETLFKNYPRDVVVSKFLQSADQSTSVDSIFYLLHKKERLRVINHVVYNQEALQVDDIWHYLNKAERTYLLGSILSRKCDFNLKLIFTQLSKDEQLLAYKHYKDGTYPYKLPYYLTK